MGDALQVDPAGRASTALPGEITAVGLEAPQQSWRWTTVGQRQGRGLSWVLMVPYWAAIARPQIPLSCLAPKSQWWQPHAVGDPGKGCVTCAFLPPPPAHSLQHQECAGGQHTLLQGSRSPTPSVSSASTETSLHPTPPAPYSLLCAVRDGEVGSEELAAAGCMLHTHCWLLSHDLPRQGSASGVC